MRLIFFCLLPFALLAQRPAAKPIATDAAITGLTARLKAAPKDPVISTELAGAYLQKMRESADGAYLERARRLIDETLEKHPQHYAARRRRLEIDLMLHRFQEVIADGRKLLVGHPPDATVLGLVGDAQMERGDYDAAADTYQQMGDLQPGLASYNRIGFYRFVTGDAPGAIEAMRLAIRAGAGGEPENLAWCLTDLGMMLFKTGVLADAEQAFYQALIKFPGYHPAHAGLGRVQAARGEHTAAIQSVLAAQQRAPFPEYAGLLAKLYRKTNQPEPALRQLALLDLADRLDKAAGEATNRHLALAYADLNHRPARALELARAELASRQDVYTYDALAWALYRQGDLPAAAEAMKKALAQKTPEPTFHLHAAAIQAALGQPEAAAASRRQAQQLNIGYVALLTETATSATNQ